MVVSDIIITDTLLHVTFLQEQSLAAIEALLETCASEFPEAPEQLYAIKDLTDLFDLDGSCGFFSFKV